MVIFQIVQRDGLHLCEFVGNAKTAEDLYFIPGVNLGQGVQVVVVVLLLLDITQGIWVIYIVTKQLIVERKT